MRKLLKFLGYALAGLVVLVGGLAVFVYFSSNATLAKLHRFKPRPVLPAADAEALARGEHIARTRGCADCHGKDLGGAVVINDGAMGLIYAPNLTKGRGSRAAKFTDDDWVRAIRHGIGPDGRGLIIMPSEEYSHFSDPDLADVIAYAKSVPAVDRDSTPIKYGPVMRALLAFGKMKLPADALDHANVAPASVRKASTPEYGRYLAHACTGCHGPNFSGGKIEIGPPSWPEARNLTPDPSGDLAKWSEKDFFRALREGKRPDGSELSTVMPRAFGGMDDTELRAIYLFLRMLPPVPKGQR